LPGARIGTIDKFQGQEAPLVVYSMTTSSRADGRHGISLQLKSAQRCDLRRQVFLVVSPAVFEVDCRTPAQMRLANAYLSPFGAGPPALILNRAAALRRRRDHRR
jgi:hypothetical protein